MNGHNLIHDWSQYFGRAAHAACCSFRAGTKSCRVQGFGFRRILLNDGELTKKKANGNEMEAAIYWDHIGSCGD